MKRIGFIGAYDKTDLILNIAKILTIMQQRVLMVDSTIMQKAKYIVPAINPTLTYITDFEDIDVAVGFNNMEDIKGYLGIEEGGELPYDIVLVDADTPEKIQGFNLLQADKNYFVTAFDMYSLKKGIKHIGLWGIATFYKLGLQMVFIRVYRFVVDQLKIDIKF